MKFSEPVTRTCDTVPARAGRDAVVRTCCGVRRELPGPRPAVSRRGGCWIDCLATRAANQIGRLIFPRSFILSFATDCSLSRDPLSRPSISPVPRELRTSFRYLCCSFSDSHRVPLCRDPAGGANRIQNENSSKPNGNHSQLIKSLF